MLKSVPELIQEIRPKIRCVTAAEAKQEMAHNDGVLIDVREPMEAAQNPTPYALNIPRGVLEMKVTALHPQEETPIYIHCATGARATLSAEQLLRIGYQHVSVITCDIETICSS
jgi:rhodanese-related sulfurtransferase